MAETFKAIGKEAQTQTFGYNADGLLTTLTTAHNNQTTHFAYGTVGNGTTGNKTTGKLSDITFANGAVHQYSYNPLGFRTATKRSDNSSISYLYDSLGNLNKLTNTDTQAKHRSQTLTVNPLNQLTKVSNSGQPPLTIKYTAKGNPKTITQHSKTSRYQYDKLGRLTDINDSINGQSHYDYQKGEADIRLQLDDRTRPVQSIQHQISSHDQTQTAFLYARLNGSPWQAVIWNEPLGKLLLPSPHMLNSPDAGYQSGKQRRRLYNAISVHQADQYAFDKASNSFFLPPEYQSANCYYGCKASLWSLQAPTQVKVGQSVSIVANVTQRNCLMFYYLDVEGASTLSTTGYFNHTFTSAGSKSISVRSACQMCPLIGQQVTQTIEVATEPTPPSNVTLAAPAVITLLDNYTLTTNVTPSSVTISNYKIDIRKATATTWYTLYNGPNKSFSSYAKVAGLFKIRVTVTANNQQYTSQEKIMEVQFPSYSVIVANPTVQLFARNIWQSILANTTPTLRSEQGLWIRLNTATKQFEFTDVIEGPRTINDNEAKIELGGRPTDSKRSPTPLDTVTYTVASFHGHTPTTYTSFGRIVGPSFPYDEDADEQNQVPGLIYDYLGSPLGSKKIPGGHPITSLATIYPSGLIRRPLAL